MVRDEKLTTSSYNCLLPLHKNAMKLKFQHLNQSFSMVTFDVSLVTENFESHRQIPRLFQNLKVFLFHAFLHRKCNKTLQGLEIDSGRNYGQAALAFQQHYMCIFSKRIFLEGVCPHFHETFVHKAMENLSKKVYNAIFST